MNPLDDLLQTATETLTKVLEEGAKKPRSQCWTEEDALMHALKCIRHMTTYLLIKHGYQEPDGENHAELAATRALMTVHLH